VVAIAATSALLVGFLTGLISFKVKSRWCPQCGAMTTADIPAATTPPHTPSTPGWSALPTQSYTRSGEREHSPRLNDAARTAAVDDGPEDTTPARPSDVGLPGLR
jgi:hypothetical protein